MNFTFKEAFISYGRRESLNFVARLHQQLKLAGYDGWFDKVNIPDGDDYAPVSYTHLTLPTICSV